MFCLLVLKTFLSCIISKVIRTDFYSISSMSRFILNLKGTHSKVVFLKCGPWKSERIEFRKGNLCLNKWFLHLNVTWQNSRKSWQRVSATTNCPPILPDSSEILSIKRHGDDHISWHLLEARFSSLSTALSNWTIVLELWK